MKEHSQEMDEKVMMQHVELYVNKYSIDLGLIGRAAITQMFNLAQEKGIIPEIEKTIFIDLLFYKFHAFLFGFKLVFSGMSLMFSLERKNHF